jgi:hypothetical protein
LASPKGKAVISLWILGLLLMYLAPAPVTITPEMQNEYETLIRDADNLDRFGDTLGALKEAQSYVYDAQVWFWRWRPEYRTVVEERQKKVDKIQAEVNAIQAKRQQMLQDANAKVGIWSRYGLAEARERFWSAFESGKVFATRQTFWQMFFSLFNARDNVLGIFLEWILTAMINFALGLCGALFYFVFSLGSMIWTFSPSMLSGLLFYAVALLGATSVVATYLAGVFGLGAGGVYVIGAVANRQLQLKYERERQREALGGRGSFRNEGHRD